MNAFKHSQTILPDLFKPPEKPGPKRPGRRSRLVFGTPGKPGDALIFLVSFLVYLMGIFPSMVFALPSDPTVQAGSATINQPSPETMVIQQATDQAIIDWRAFGIAASEQVEFQLPSSNGVTLNRVTGNERSDIFGTLKSNGNLFLINPNGILFGAGSRVDVHGLVATTGNISNQDFLAGHYNFNIPSTRGGIVVNRGRITAAQGGLVALVAPGVQNFGVIEARLGRVGLASGNTFTLDLYGDQLINLGLDSKITEQITGLEGEVLSSLVSNSGAIYADGGRVRLEVNAARDVVDRVINMSGIIQAKTVVEQNGSIVLLGGDEGLVDVSGTLDASGVNEDETGGTVHVFGDRIGLFDSALLNASGHSGGGEILVGGDYQGQGDYPTASEVFVEEEVSIFNDALWSGDGGRSIFWANRRMRFFGSVFARGGRKNGNGGFIEVSGKEELFFDGWADTSAPNGLRGTLLLDPDDVVIGNGSGSASGAATFFENTLEALSGNTDINILATNSITMNNLSDNVLNLNISGSLTMTAGIGGITFLDTNDKIQSNRAISLTATGGNLTLGSLESTEGNITLQGNNLILSGSISSVLGTTTLLSSNGGTIGLGTGAGTFSVSGTELQNITAADLVVGNGTTGNITVGGISAANSNNIAGTVTLKGTKSGSSVTFANGGSTFKKVTVNSADGITLNSDLAASSNANLSAGTKITLANGVNVSSDGTLSLSATSGVNAQGSATVSSANGITLNDDFTSAGATTFDADSNDDGTGSFTVASGKTVATGNNSLSITGGNIALNGSLNSGTGTTTLLASKAGTTIGLGAGAGAFGVSGAELQNITAGNLVVGDSTNGDINVDGVTAANSNNIAGTTTLNATKSSSKVTFANTGSTFNGLTVHAGSEIAADASVTADAGNLVLNGGTGGITGTGTTTLTASQGLTLNSSLNSTGNANLSAGTGITLANGVNVSSGGTLSLAATTGGITAQGAVAVNSASGITLNDDFNSNGTTTFDADSNDNGAGSFIVADGKTVSTGNNALSVTGADIDLNITGSLDSGTGTTTLLVSKDGTTIGLGAGAGTFSVSDSELDRITAGNLVVGDATNGDVTVDGVTNSNNGVTLNATKTGSKATFNNNSTFAALNVNADDDVIVSGNLSTNNDSLSIKGKDLLLTGSLDSGTGTTTLLSSNGGTIGLGAGAGSFSVTGTELQNITADNLTIGDATNGSIAVDGVTGANITGTTTLNATKSGSNVAFSNSSTFGGLAVNTGGTISDNGTATLNVTGASSFTGTQGISLTNTANSFAGPVSLNTGGNATLATNNALTLGNSTIGGTQVMTVVGGNGLIVSGNQTVGGTISMTTDSNITLTGALVTSSASASAVTLNSTTGGIFDGDVTGTLDIDAASGGLVVNSVTGFGTPGNAIETKVASVDINNTGTGEINIFETDGLDVVNINHSGTGDVNVSYFGTLSGESNALAANGVKNFTNRDSGSVVLPEFGKTLSEVSIDKTVSILPNLEDNYFFGNQPPATQGKTVTEIFSSPESGPFVTNVFDESFELIQVAKRSRKAHSGLRGFSNFWGPLGPSNTEMVKRPSKRSLGEEAKLKKKKRLLRMKKKQAEKKARSKIKNARVKRVGDTAALPKVQKKKKTTSWLGSKLGNFFK
ncbi:MAG: hypothetical protein NPINA01_15520 [Nitrospinaceae bacterium]|nr:MAG: hypothetical protein NPINA01_15520 [Nitrospinaceae bacterium]